MFAQASKATSEAIARQLYRNVRQPTRLTNLSARRGQTNQRYVMDRIGGDKARQEYRIVALAAAATGALILSNGVVLEENRTNLDASVASVSIPGVLGQGTSSEAKAGDDNDDEGTTNVINWSGTHSVTIENKKYWEPESVEEVEAIVRDCHKKGQKLRPVGSSLSPNGLALNADGMISMSNVDKVIDVDVEQRTVTVQAGCTVNRVVEALRPYNLTLPNLASIAEQQMGGFVQVGAHGTGRLVAPVDNYVTKIKLVTPAFGTITLTKDNGALFELAKVGLGCLGVVVEVTMECIPAHRLVEHTFVLTRKEAKEQLDTLLKEHKHMRYMWIPYADAVVVVTNDPEDSVSETIRNKAESRERSFSPEEASRPFINLLKELAEKKGEPYLEEDLKSMGFGELRDAVLAYDPLDVDHVKKCNKAEAEYWRRSEGYRVEPSDKLLQFDCGGQQWVFEVCFATGTVEQDNGNDMQFMDDLLDGIEAQGIPGHSPLEQRWSSSSSSLMSPAHGPPEGLHSWVGIIFYLPTDDETQRRDITEAFTGKYCDLARSVGKPMIASSHWAKLEQPRSSWAAVDLRMLLQTKYPVEEFNKARAKFDPKSILASPLIDAAFGNPKKS